MIFSVTQSDIDKGVKKNCFRCPVAMAIRRKLLGAQVTVNNMGLTIRGGAFHWFGMPPACVSVFIHRFDLGQSVKPFDFELPAEECYQIDSLEEGAPQ